MVRSLGPDALQMIAERFKALAEPARLTIVHALMEQEASVSEIVDRTGFGQANVSKHLQILHRHGFVTRRKEGLFVHYAVADPSVFQLCDIMCGQLEAEARERSEALSGP